MLPRKVMHFLLSLTVKFDQNGDTTGQQRKRNETDLGYMDRISLGLHRKGINLQWQLARAPLCSLPNTRPA